MRLHALKKPGPKPGPNGKRFCKSICIDHQEERLLEKIAAQKNLSISELIRFWIGEEIKK